MIEFNQVYNMDCVSGMKKMPDGCVDLVITDPPFAIEFGAKRSNYNRDEGKVLKGYAEVKKEDYFDFTMQWMREVHRVLNDSGSMYVFSGWNHLKDILIAIDNIGFITINHLIWKYQFGVVTKNKYVTSHYHCLYVCKNDKKRKFYHNARFHGDLDGGSARYKDMEDVWIIDREYWAGDIKTPTKLPTELVAKILKYSSQKDNVVLDPFLGSGQVAVCSKTLKRRYLGFEIVKDYYDFIQNRLDKVIPSEQLQIF